MSTVDATRAHTLALDLLEAADDVVALVVDDRLDARPGAGTALFNLGTTCAKRPLLFLDYR
jgi:hypothetical protein